MGISNIALKTISKKRVRTNRSLYWKIWWLETSLMKDIEGLLLEKLLTYWDRKRQKAADLFASWQSDSRRMTGNSSDDLRTIYWILKHIYHINRSRCSSMRYARHRSTTVVHQPTFIRQCRDGYADYRSCQEYILISYFSEGIPRRSPSVSGDLVIVYSRIPTHPSLLPTSAPLGASKN